MSLVLFASSASSYILFIMNIGSLTDPPGPAFWRPFMVLCSDHKSLIFVANMLVMTLRRTSSREIGLILSSFVDPGVLGTRTTVISLSYVGMHPRWMQRLTSCMMVVRKLSSSFFRRAAERSEAPGVLLPIRFMVLLNSSRSRLLGISLLAGIC